jgi:hypothetical protein
MPGVIKQEVKTGNEIQYVGSNKNVSAGVIVTGQP